MNNNLQNLVSQVKTDISGKWVNRNDLVEYTNFVILQCANLLDNPNEGFKIKQKFGLVDEKLVEK